MANAHSHAGAIGYSTSELIFGVTIGRDSSVVKLASNVRITFSSICAACVFVRERMIFYSQLCVLSFVSPLIDSFLVWRLGDAQHTLSSRRSSMSIGVKTQLTFLVYAYVYDISILFLVRLFLFLRVNFLFVYVSNLIFYSI